MGQYPLHWSCHSTKSFCYWRWCDLGNLEVKLYLEQPVFQCQLYVTESCNRKNSWIFSFAKTLTNVVWPETLVDPVQANAFDAWESVQCVPTLQNFKSDHKENVTSDCYTFCYTFRLKSVIGVIILNFVFLCFERCCGISQQKVGGCTEINE